MFREGERVASSRAVDPGRGESASVFLEARAGVQGYASDPSPVPGDLIY